MKNSQIYLIFKGNIAVELSKKLSLDTQDLDFEIPRPTPLGELLDIYDEHGNIIEESYEEQFDLVYYKFNEKTTTDSIVRTMVLYAIESKRFSNYTLLGHYPGAYFR